MNPYGGPELPRRIIGRRASAAIGGHRWRQRHHLRERWFGDGSFMQWPKSRWSYNHIDELVPTKSVWRGSGAAIEMPSAPLPLDQLTIEPTLMDTTDRRRATGEIQVNGDYTMLGYWRLPEATAAAFMI